ncbi:MAG: response regulator [Campylobacterales bacterium]|nr:response regulator [Campylobacterales bacterium]
MNNSIKEVDSILLTSDILHTLRNSLNAILGYSQILQDDDSDADEQRRMQISIENAALNIKSLVSIKKEALKNDATITLKNQKTNKESCSVKNSFMNQKVLIVDDKPENLSLFSDILRPFHYDLSLATSGVMALESLKTFHPDLILLDVVMPQMNGYEVLQEIKKDKRTCDIPVIFLTAKDTTEDIVKGLEAGAVDYIAKPFHPKELIARVSTHLEKARVFANLKRLMEHSFHELYTPLSVISSAMQIQELEHEKTDYTQMTLAACKTLQNIYDDLYYSIQYKNRVRPKIVFDFATLLLQRIHYFSLVAQSRSLKFKTNLPNQMLLQLNQEDMERVVDNLLSNALKYTQECGEITISLVQNHGMWIFSICNPIAKEIDAQKIFMKYYRQEEEVFGLGLGLELVQTICKENSIKINASTEDELFCIQMELEIK